jgi:hypothetical protein
MINAAPSGIIHGMLIFDNVVSFEKVKENFQNQYISGADRDVYYRLRQLVHQPMWFWAYWTDLSPEDQCDDLFIKHDEPISHLEMQDKVANWENIMMDPSRPLWQVHVYTNFTSQEGRVCTAMLMRIHHTNADGFVLLRMILQGCDPKKPPAKPKKERQPVARPSVFANFLGLLSACKKLLLLPDDPTTVFKNGHFKIGDANNCAWSTLSYSVDDIKRLGKKCNATVNDILLFAISHALHKWGSADKGEEDLDLNLLTLIWVSLSKMSNIYKSTDELPLKWGNAGLGAVYMDMPITSQDPITVLRRIQASIEPLKFSPEPLVAGKLLQVMGNLPRAVLVPVWPGVSNKVSLSMSNVPGPQFKVSFLDEPMDKMVFFSPPQDTIGLFVTLITFNGKITFGFNTDDAVMNKEDTNKVTHKYIDEALQALSDAADESSA